MALATEINEGTGFITHPSHPVEKRICLDIGSGPAGAIRHSIFSGEGWQVLRLDANKAVNPDIVAEAHNLSAISDNYADAIWCKSLIDHLYYDQAMKAFREFRRVLKHGAAAIIVVLDGAMLQDYARRYGLERVRYCWGPDKKPITVGDQMFGNRDEIFNQGLRFMEKHWSFNMPDLTKYLQDAGFSDVRVERNDEWMKDALYARAWK